MFKFKIYKVQLKEKSFFNNYIFVCVSTDNENKIQEALKKFGYLEQYNFIDYEEITEQQAEKNDYTVYLYI